MHLSEIVPSPAGVPVNPPHLARPLHCSKRQNHILEGFMKPPRQFFAPLAVGAPAPLRELPVRLERMIHFVPSHNEKVRAKVPELVPQVDGPWDIHYLDQLLAQLEGRHGLKKPILIHAILETAQGVNNVEAIATASPRMHGMSLGPADLAASRAMKTTRVGGGHPEYKLLADADGEKPRATSQQDLWHYTIAKMVDACAAAGIKPFYGPFGDFSDPAACEVQFRNAFLMGCLGAWSLHPSQIEIAKKVFSPDPREVAFAKKIVETMPDGAGAVMIDGKMQDDATWKQAKVLLDLAKLVATKDPAMAARYGV